VLVVTLGRLGDIHGRVRMHNLVFAVLTVFSILLAATPLSGAGGALCLTSLSRATPSSPHSIRTASSASAPSPMRMRGEKRSDCARSGGRRRRGGSRQRVALGARR